MDKQLDIKHQKAWEWWRSLSYNEQDAILKKNGDYYVVIHKYRCLCTLELLTIIEKEGVVL